ncbi:hypothetical protein [Mycobacterium intracellulare]|uniref:Uncharacterized protein n=1 Tax=Mycobacterium intracellulare subsp. chimaera TaxID=222805 RepID=A0ABT7P2L8_MYCIT|nr:hypothetical protein [Mycobacterium intracellulare]MDM3927507.1 hypothetical protein [Mycobacterium intracellulare subsp. chimaera]
MSLPVPPQATNGQAESLHRLLDVRRALLAEEADAPSPAVARALEMADVYLFLAISYLGHTDHLFPEER